MRDVTRFVVRGHHNRSYSIAVTGPLHGDAASSLRHLLHELERAQVTVDLTECTGVTVDALDALEAASRIAEAHGGTLRLHPEYAASH